VLGPLVRIHPAGQRAGAGDLGEPFRVLRQR